MRMIALVSQKEGIFLFALCLYGAAEILAQFPAQTQIGADRPKLILAKPLLWQNHLARSHQRKFIRFEVPLGKRD